MPPTTRSATLDDGGVTLVSTQGLDSTPRHRALEAPRPNDPLFRSLLGDFIDQTSGAERPGRTTRNALGRTTTNDPERTTPNGTAPEARDARCPHSETGFSLAVSDTHSGSGKDHQAADAW